MSRILIVEDGRSPSPARLKRQLRQAGHEVETSRNTEMMWAALLRRPAHMIILRLPDDSGRHVVPLLRECYPDSAVLLMRADAPADGIAAALARGSRGVAPGGHVCRAAPGAAIGSTA